MVEIAVLREGVHGMPIEEYVTELRDRLPDHTVRAAASPREERELLGTAEAATGLHVDADVVGTADALELFHCLYAGVDHLPLDAFAERGVAVTNSAGVHGPNAAEWTIGAILTFARGLHEGWRRGQRREWRHYQAGELADSTVTVVGLGNIGEAIVERLAGFEVETIGVRHSPSKGGPTDEVVGYDRDAVHEALGRTDYLVLACPLTDTTRGLIDGPALTTLPPDAVLVNLARGPVVDTDALVATLRGEKLRGAALDVTDPEPLPEDHPLWGLENVLITPHVAGQTPRYYERSAAILERNLERVAETGEYADLENQVTLGD